MAGGIPAAAAESAGWTAKYGVAAAGTLQTDGTAIGHTVSVVTSATGSSADSLVLPPAPVSIGDGADICIIMNESGATLNIYPTTGQKIDDGAANAAATLANNAVGIYFGLFDGTVGHWWEVEV
jgi:hypothetical protein